MAKGSQSERLALVDRLRPATNEEVPELWRYVYTN